MKKIIFSSIIGLGLLTSCADLDISPKGMMTEDALLSNTRSGGSKRKAEHAARG